MPGRPAILALMLALGLALFGPSAAAAGEPPVAAEPQPAPPPAGDDSRAERQLLRILHFEFGLVSACGLADDEVRAGYEIAADRLERRLGIDGDAEARFRELNRGWTEADARWAAADSASFRERCRTEAVVDRDRFKQAFRDTGQTLQGATPPLGGVAMLTLAVTLFVLAHLVLPIPGVRGPLAGRLGERGYLVLYSALSLALFGWMIAAFAAAPDAPLWRPPTGLRHLALAIVFAAALLIAAGYSQGNPSAALIDRLAGEQPRGIIRVTRHPVLWGIGLWAAAHLLANGRLRDVVLFSGLGLLAFLGAALIDHRRRRTGGAAWRALEEKTSSVPFAAILAGRAGAGLKKTLAEIGWWRFLLGVLLYAALFLAHPWLTGLAAFRI